MQCDLRRGGGTVGVLYRAGCALVIECKADSLREVGRARGIGGFDFVIISVAELHRIVGVKAQGIKTYGRKAAGSGKGSVNGVLRGAGGFIPTDAHIRQIGVAIVRYT